jgi:hypothetical protein
MSALTIPVFRNVSLVNRIEVFNPANQQHNNAIETSNFATSTLLIYRFVQLRFIVQYCIVLL